MADDDAYDDDAIAAFARAQKRKVRVRLGLIGAVVAAPFLYLGWRCHGINAAQEARREEYRKERELTDADRAALRAGLAEARQRLTAARAAWARAVAPEALAISEPGDARCDIRLVAPTAQAASSYTRYGSIDANYYGNVFFRRHPAGEPIPPLDIDADLAGLTEIAAELDANKADRDDLDRVRRFDDTALFVVVDKEVPPVVLGVGEASSYMPGRLVGAAYVYSYSQQRITCAGDFEAENGASIEFDYSYMEDNVLDKDSKMREAARATLQRDLDVRVQQALVRSLRRVAPAGAAGGGSAAGDEGAAGDEDAADGAGAANGKGAADGKGAAPAGAGPGSGK